MIRLREQYLDDLPLATHDMMAALLRLTWRSAIIARLVEELENNPRVLLQFGPSTRP